ncbi:MAG: metallophosphoesterase, partial [Chryseobacterium sp.]|nr:metallophosphoesterase [Chryseobacterium sp.]
GKITLSDNYDLNEYQYKKPKFNVFSTNLNLGYNPDDGVIVGLNTSWTKKGFNQNPFSSKHTLKTNYFNLSNGYEIRYEGIFPRIVGNWFYQIDAGYTDSHYIRNYFGNGNLTINNHDTFEEKYYRVRAREFYAKPSINWRKNASLFSAKLIYEGLKIEKTENRRIAIPNIVDENVFSTNYFAGIDVGFHFENVNKKVNPSLGMKFDSKFTYRQNLNNGDKKLPTFETGLGFTHYLTKNEKLTFSTYAKAKWLLSDDYEFYQMATLGGDDDLRGFRFDRFYGKSSFYQTSDIRWSIGNFRNAFVPLNIGIFGGFDYGRVWLPNEFTKKWHTSAGAGIWLNAIDMVGIQAYYFRSSDKGRFVVGFGMNF